MPPPDSHDAPPHIRAWREGRIADPRHLAPPLSGAHYLRLIAAAHREFAPTRYFEIGTLKGASLALAACPSVAVDPRFLLPEGFLDGRPATRLFAQTSDAFFAAHDLTEELGGPVDLAFLDGMHRFEFLLRDFINTERHCTPGSVVMLHDCVPVCSQIAHRHQGAPRIAVHDVMPGAWAGDVWKLLPILREHRPGLRLDVFDARPTGLVLVTGLDPASRVLTERYEQIVAGWMERDITQQGVGAFVAAQNMIDTNAALAPGALRALTGLPPRAAP